MLGGAVQLRRYRGAALVGLSLAATFVGLDLALRGLLGDGVFWHRPNVFWVYVERIGSQVAAVEARQQAGQLPPADLVVLLGVSSVLRDFDGRLLHENDPLHRRWLVLGGGGGTMTRLEVYAQPLLHSPLQFRQVFIGIHPMMLWDGGEPEPPTEDIDNMLQTVSPPALRSVQATLLRQSWLGQRWQRTYDWCRVGLFRARLALLAACGQDCQASFDPLLDPWAAYQMRESDRNTSEALAQQWERLRARCRPERYVGAGREVAALTRLVRRLRDCGAAVTIVRMPEHSRLRHELDAAVLARLDAAVAIAGGAQPLPVLDLSAVLQDDFFFDHSHLNARGRACFSQAFPTWMNDAIDVAAQPAPNR